MDLIEKAKEIAISAHKNQVRKTDGSPYIGHPIAVAEILIEHGFSGEVVAAGFLHDVLEDTDVVKANLRAELGDEVVDIVSAVSENKNLEWEERKENYIKQVVIAGESAWAVSVADKIHNAESLIEFHHEHGDATWANFNRGKEQKIWFEKKLYNQLKKVWKHSLLDRYSELIKQLEALA